MPTLTLPPLLPIEGVANITTLSASTIRRLVDRGDFPAPVALPGSSPARGRRLAWRGADVLAWLESLKPHGTQPREEVSHE